MGPQYEGDLGPFCPIDLPDLTSVITFSKPYHLPRSYKTAQRRPTLN